MLQQLAHYNDNIRQDATESLKHFFIQFPSSLHHNLNLFITKLLGKSVDLHFVVRKNFISCLEHVFKNVTQGEIQPFFPVVMAHLNCAMTHINEEIQSDSLKFLDLCLDYFPDLFIENCDKVFHSFLDMVSQSQGSSLGKYGGSKKNKSQINRDVLIKPDGKMSSLRAKKDALEKLLKIVSLVFIQRKESMGMDHPSSNCNQIVVNRSRGNFILHKYKCVDDHNKEVSGEIQSGLKIPLETEKVMSIKNLILSFLPVLFHCWNDCNPSSYTLSSVDKKNDSALSIMCSIVFVLKSVVSSQVGTEYLKVFIQDYFEDFEKYILAFFPFSWNSTQSQTLNHGLQNGILNVNIAICEIYCKLFASYPPLAKDSYGNFEKVLDYVKSVSYGLRSSKKIDSLESIQEVIAVLVQVLFKSRCKDLKDIGKMFCHVFVSNAQQISMKFIEI